MMPTRPINGYQSKVAQVFRPVFNIFSATGQKTCATFFYNKFSVPFPAGQRPAIPQRRATPYVSPPTPSKAESLASINMR